MSEPKVEPIPEPIPEHGPVSYRTYWSIWGILLVLTLIMIVLDSAPLPRGVLLVLLVAAMLVKAFLVAGYFMHLRYERLALALGVTLGFLLTGLVLFVLLVPDGLRILELSNR